MNVREREGEKEKEREKHLSVAFQGSNPQPFGIQDDAPTTEQRSQGSPVAILILAP